MSKFVSKQFINVKTEHFTLKQNNIATIAKALGHPARVAIVEYLMKVDTCICGDIVNELPLAQPTISQHLKELKNAGIIKGQISGTSVCYCLSDAHLDAILTLIHTINLSIPKSCCDDTP